MSTRTKYVLVVLAVLAVAAAVTVLSRRWWARRIRAKYAEALKDRPGITEEHLASEYTLAELASLWTIGNPAWDEGDGNAWGTWDEEGNAVILGQS